MLLAMREALKNSRARKGSQQNKFPKILGNQRICFLGVPVVFHAIFQTSGFGIQSPKQLITSPVTMMVTSLKVEESNKINNLSQVQDYPSEFQHDIAPEKLPKTQKRKGKKNPSNHHGFSGVNSLLNFKGVSC